MLLDPSSHNPPEAGEWFVNKRVERDSLLGGVYSSQPLSASATGDGGGGRSSVKMSPAADGFFFSAQEASRSRRAAAYFMAGG